LVLEVVSCRQPLSFTSQIEDKIIPDAGKLPRQSIYPGLVSPLQYEPLFTRSEDVLWKQDSAEERSDHDEGIQAAKRRRIENAGKAYLRGEPLFILSASI
jgi:hypothetical protein